jgi:AhpD family alkylhydroperoxidase
MRRFVICILLAVSAGALAQQASDAEATYQDIQKTLGFVPGFFRAFPESGIAGAWEELKNVQMSSKTALPPRVKELIGLAVAAQIPCRYCAYFHSHIAKANGANDNQVKEAIAIAALERHWSTFLNGMQIDVALFRQEVAKMFSRVGKKPASDVPPVAITDAASAYQDIQRTFGMIPTFMKQFPAEGIAGAWREAKSLMLAPNTSIEPKVKNLIALAVSAQTPCNYCTYFDTEAAKHEGATDDEIREAVVLAAITRHWSTVLNGSLIDEAAFRKDVDRIVKNVEKSVKTAQEP